VQDLNVVDTPWKHFLDDAVLFIDSGELQLLVQPDSAGDDRF
jgi:hypothetical protein